MRHQRDYGRRMNARDEDGPALAIGRRVRLHDGTGEIVEDFGELAGTEVVVDSDMTARARRWAVRLDDGTLQFVDDDDLEPLP